MNSLDKTLLSSDDINVYSDPKLYQMKPQITLVKPNMIVKKRHALMK